MAHYFDGKWLETNDMKISVFDISFLRGFGAFEYLRTYNKKPFMLEEHIDRLFKTAEEISLTIPISREEIIAIVHEGIKKSSFEEVGVKIIITGGVSDDGISVGTPSTVVMFIKAGSVPQESYNNGVKLISEEYYRYIPKAKSINYMAAVVTYQKAKKEKAFDVLYTYNGLILEGTTYNFYAVMKGKVYTAEDDILYGITRKFVLDIGRKGGVEFVLGELKVSQIPEFEEAFITSSTREVLPIVLIDDKTIGDGKVGPVTKQLMELFNKEKYNQ